MRLASPKSTQLMSWPCEKLGIRLQPEFRLGIHDKRVYDLTFMQAKYGRTQLC